MPSDATQWWRQTVGYEVYLRSFADGNDDGIGDLPGLTSRLEHLAWLGVGVVWITPFYPSPMADFGYDVADYTDVHPTFGTLDDFDALVARADELGLRVVIDLVPNHTSSAHPWFRAARSSPDDPKRDYYLWRDRGPEGEPPNNWVGYFGGSVWSHDEEAGQEYLHMFLPQQPDLNWRNPAVIDEFDAILRFWLDRGVSGFRVDVAQALVKDAELRSNPELRPVDHDAPRWEQWESFDHRHDILQPETLDIFRRWRAIVEEYDAVLIGETYVLEPDQLAHLVRGDGLHVGFWFKPMHLEWGTEEIRNVLRSPVEHGVHDIGWVQGSHDEPRPPTRFGGGSTGLRRSMAFLTMLVGLPGMPFVYQGEELALADGIVPDADKADPIGGDETESGRDGCRTPMPWSLVPGEGFSPTASPWLPSSHDTVDQTVAGQRDDPTSPLHRTRALFAVRERLHPDTPVEWPAELNTDLVGFRRGTIDVVLNAGTEATTAPPLAGTVLYSSVDLDRIGETADSIKLDIDEALVIHRV